MNPSNSFETGAATPQLQPSLDERQTAHILGIGVTNLQRRRWAGQPPKYIKIGARVLYRPEDIEAFIAECARKAAAGDGKRKKHAGEQETAA